MVTMKSKDVNARKLEKELKSIGTFFRDIENDKTLPTFGDFFVHCMILGIAEQVNLKKMYPKMYLKVSKMLAEQQGRILVTRT